MFNMCFPGIITSPTNRCSSVSTSLLIQSIIEGHSNIPGAKLTTTVFLSMSENCVFILVSTDKEANEYASIGHFYSSFMIEIGSQLSNIAGIGGHSTMNCQTSGWKGEILACAEPEFIHECSARYKFVSGLTLPTKN
jgi:hypothetical protein